MLDAAGGVLLGLDTRERPEVEVSFPPGSCLAMFTDGLIERRDEGIDDGIAWLADELKAALPPEPAQLCAAWSWSRCPATGAMTTRPCCAPSWP